MVENVRVGRRVFQRRALYLGELISRLAVAESRAGRAWKMISLTIPKADEEVTPETFRWSFDWERIREARAKDEGTCLLRTNLEECDPKTLWRKYMIQGEIEYAFRELKGDLGLLLGALGLTLPAQPPPKISGNAAAQETNV
jgi:hypothetical protein